MATYFVSSVDGDNGDTGADWTNAKATVAGALAVATSDGDIIKVDSAHAFTAGAAITWTPTANVSIISVNRAGADAWLAGAVEAVGASNTAFTVAGANGKSMFVYGMTLRAGSNNNATCEVILLPTASVSARLEMWSCTLEIASINVGAQIVMGDSSGNGGNMRSHPILLRDCTFLCSASRAGTLIFVHTTVAEIINPTFSTTGATKPAILFGSTLGNSAILVIRDGDASGYLTTSGALFDLTNMGQHRVLLRNLKISGTPTLTTGSWPTGSAGDITLRNVDSGDTINVFEYRNAYGTLTEETAIYVAATEFAGAAASWKVVTTAACLEAFPFRLPPLYLWNTETGAQTATVNIAQDGTTTDLTDREIWLELSYPATASFPNFTNDDDRNANPFTGAAVDQPNATSVWTGLGGTNDQQTLDVAFTAAEKGLIEGVVVIAKASLTVYIDPRIAGVTAAGAGDDVWLDPGALMLPAAAAGSASAHVLGARGGVIS